LEGKGGEGRGEAGGRGGGGGGRAPTKVVAAAQRERRPFLRRVSEASAREGGRWLAARAKQAREKKAVGAGCWRIRQLRPTTPLSHLLASVAGALARCSHPLRSHQRRRVVCAPRERRLLVSVVGVCFRCAAARAGTGTELVLFWRSLRSRGICRRYPHISPSPSSPAPPQRRAPRSAPASPCPPPRSARTPRAAEALRRRERRGSRRPHRGK
jgi:hypothetical protein